MISFVSATEIGISPSKLEFSGNVGEVICKDITLITKDKEVLSGEDRWSGRDSRDLKVYNSRADWFGIEIDYVKSTEFKGSQNIEVCLRGLESGTYYGALIYQTGSAGVGTWIKAIISEDENKAESGIVRITGNVISENNSGMLVFVVGEVIFLVIIFISLVYIVKKMRKNSKTLF
ncbi:MAG: hypothetical protein ABH840_04635 [Nanoarchaeota archaeon]